MKQCLTILLCFICCNLFSEVYEIELLQSINNSQYVKVKVCGVVAKLFVFDTGCSDILVNQQLFNDLESLGKVKKSDLGEPHDAILANGTTYKVRDFVLSEITLGECVFRDIRASVGVTDNDKASLLLGQSIIERFKWYEMRNGFIRFEPIDVNFQKALSFVFIHQEDSTFSSKIINLLMPYFENEELTCSYNYILLDALYSTDDYDRALIVLNKMETKKCQELDLKRERLHILLNKAIVLYNSEKYEESLSVLNEMWPLAKEYKKDKHYEENAGGLYWSIYKYLGNDNKAKLYEKYKKD